jgi:hypothetical protein
VHSCADDAWATCDEQPGTMRVGMRLTPGLGRARHATLLM